MRVINVPCLRDNFSYLISADEADDTVGQWAPDEVVVVDPCDPDPILQELRSSALRLTGILNTHHHGDHVGGNKRLLEEYPGIPVYAHVSDKGRIPGQTHYLEEGDEVQAAGLLFKVLFIPGHTRGHIAYVTKGAAFVGDTVFAAGCGRLFEGDPQMMNDSINNKLAKLPPDTKLYFAHEYTQANLKFALDVEPENQALQKRATDVAARRSQGLWTTPTTIAEEQRTNPFFRVAEPAVIRRFEKQLHGHTDPASVFGAVRAAKDVF